MNDINNDVRIYRDRIRLFLILYFFSEEYNNPEYPNLKRVFKTEVKLQKLDFLLRYPDYLAYGLLTLVQEKSEIKSEIKEIVKSIFNTREPILRKLEMERFLFGAWEYLDDVIAFLISCNLIKYDSNKDSRLYTIDKQYFITELAVERMNRKKRDWGDLLWYVERCKLIKKYLGHLSGSQLKAMQYDVGEYSEALYNSYIKAIPGKVKELFYRIYQEPL